MQLIRSKMGLTLAYKTAGTAITLLYPVVDTLQLILTEPFLMFTSKQILTVQI